MRRGRRSSSFGERPCTDSPRFCCRSERRVHRVNPSGLPNAEWRRASISQRHNAGWTGPASGLFDAANSSNLYESSAFTSLLRVGAREVFVTYNKFNKPRSEPDWTRCQEVKECREFGSVGFGMRVTVTV